MAAEAPRTLDLLRRWNDGDRSALDALLERHLDWITDYVHRRLGPKLRSRAETVDFVQTSIVDFLRYGPKFEVQDESAFRGLFARIAENNIRDRERYFGRARRAADREVHVGTGRDTVLSLDAHRPVTRPSEQVQREENVAYVRVALELLDAADREVVWLREFEELPFAEVGEKTGLSEGAARMRFQRALPKLAEKVAQLRARGIANALEDGSPDDQGSSAR